MPEIKNTFSGGKMNKDLDERLVQNGEYRHAMNIQVRTTSGDSSGVGDAGVIQNIQGNSEVGASYLQTPFVPNISNPNEHTVIGSIANERTNKSYFFVAGLRMRDLDVTSITGKRLFLDTIMEVTVGTSVSNTVSSPVVVDKYGMVDIKDNLFTNAMISSNAAFMAAGNFHNRISFIDTSDLRVGMKIIFINSNGDNVFVGNAEPVISEILSGQSVQLSQDVSVSSFNNVYAAVFEAPRVLNFENDKKITAINIIDDLLFWTDGVTEPKKINIRRCLEGTANITSHTQLKLTDPYDENELLDYVDDLELSLSPEVNNDLKEEHITVKREAPRMAPTLKMRDTLRSGETSCTIELTGSVNVTTMGSDGGLLQQGDTIIMSTTGIGGNEIYPTTALNPMWGLDWEENDVLTFTEDTGPYAPTITVSVDPGTNLLGGNPILAFTVLSVSDFLVQPNPAFEGSGFWNITLQEEKPLFETKFGRFGLRYKYEDGEYSSFGPWSELAFLPGRFKYDHRKGYNLGMVNNVRELIIKDFIPHQRVKPYDVTAVDILYKTTDSPNVYVVKTITRGVDPEWDMYYPSAMNDEMQFGEFKVKSELIHNAVDKNQILRSWDNVPRFALAQEMAANRLIYANYTQGYNIKDSVGLHQNHIAENWVSNSLEPIKSIKSIRDYKFGMVFGDKYGRETPVISPGLLSNNTSLGTGDVRIDKQFSSYRNRFEVMQNWVNSVNSGVPEDWMEYVKYFVKETSSEYYNLIMDRWYDAEDGNIWLSFNSADRNKIDEETYLILKNEHGNNTPVIERARYRIIAIESEAPEFIRLDPRQMGQRQIGGGDLNGLFEVGTYNVDADSPTRLMGYDRELTLTADSGWNNMMGGHLVLGHAKGTVKIRINAQNGFGTILKGSMWNTLTYISQDSNGTQGTFRWKDPFLETVDFIDRFTAAGEVISGLRYFIEFREFAPENKPEYDGKFFVKVERDAVLENRVLKYEQGEADWDSVGVHYLAYIDNRNAHPALNGVNGTGPDRGNYNWQTDSGGNGVAQSGVNGPNENDGTFVAPTFGAVQSISQINGFGLGHWSSSSIGFADQTHSFWKNAIDVAHPRIWTKIFVDAAPARIFKIFGSDCGNRVDLDSNNNATGTMGDGVDPFIAYKPTGFDAGRLSYASGADIVNPTPANEFGRMAISLLPYMGESAGGGSSYGLQDWTIFNPDPSINWKELEFFQAMATPGQYFRFSYDNTGVDHLGNVSGQLYKVVSRGGGPFANNIGGDIDWWGFPGGYNGTMHVQNYAGDSWGGSDYECGNDGSSSSNSSNPPPTAFTNNWMVNGNIIGFDPPQHGDELWEFWWDDQSGSVGNFEDNFDGGIHWGPGGADCRDGFYDNATQHAQIMNGGITDDGGGSYSHGCRCNTDNDPYCGREGMRIEFRRCNPDGTLMSGPNGAGSVGIDPTIFDPRATSCHDGREAGIHIRLWKKAQIDPEKKMTVEDAAVFETEPKEDVGLDIYYEASNAIPMYLNPSNTIDFAPYNSEVLLKSVTNSNYIALPNTYENYHVGFVGYMGDYPVIGIKNNLTGNINDTGYFAQSGYFNLNQHIVFRHVDGTETMAKIVQYVAPTNSSGTELSPTGGINQLEWNVDPISEPRFVGSTQGKTGFYAIDPQVYDKPVILSWFNCYSFGNGVESDRIRDDFNAMMIDNGVKASSTFLGYGKEDKGSGLIYSGIYNSISGVNNLNEFNMAEKITKDLNPTYGTIQRLKTRDTSLVTFCEDKVLQITTNKDALYNADGDAKLIATNRVLGTAVPFAGDYGISKNPESLAWDQFRYYFADNQRGAILRLSMDGITPISSVGMKTWFRDNLPKTKQIIGTFDTVNDEYNVTLKYKYSQNKKDETVSFSEDSQGWVSFKSFVPDSGGSVGGKYLTAVKNKMWLHYVDILDTDTMSSNFGEVINRNTFYPEAPYTIAGMNSYYTPSEVVVLFNDAPGSVKTFQTLNYEGSQARVEIFTDGQDGGQLYQPDGSVYTPPYAGYYDASVGATNVAGDGEYYNLQAKDGWWVESITTDLSFNGTIREFKNKEGKWYNNIGSIDRGDLEDAHLEEFSVQGLGVIQATDTEPEVNPSVSITLTGDNINNPQNPGGLGNPDIEDSEDE